MTCQRDRRWNKGGAGKASVMIGAGERQERSNIRSLEEDGSRVPFNQLRGGNDAIEKGTEKLQEFRNKCSESASPRRQATNTGRASFSLECPASGTRFLDVAENYSKEN
jgi:hypothetical protein